MADSEYTVLIVDDHAETRRNITKLLQFESDIEVVGTAKSATDGIQEAIELNPDVVLMDINMPDVDGIKATEAIREKVPTTQIVILSVQGDANYMRRAMLAGARDFLTKPAKSDELVSVIRRAGDKAKEEKQKSAFSPGGSRNVTSQRLGGTTTQLSSLGKIIAIYSPKGGVGKTTLATNLAIALHNEDTPALVVDGDLQFGDVAVFMNERSKNSLIDLTPLADQLDPEVVDEVVIHHKTSGVDILSAPPHPEDAEKATGAQVVKVLEFMKRIYSYVIIDTDQGLSDITLDALDVSDVILLITVQDIPSIINTRVMLNLLNTLGVSQQRIMLVMNKFDKQIAITPGKISKNLNKEVSAVLPKDEEVVILAVNKGVPFMLNSGKSKDIGKSVLELAGKVRERLKHLEGSRLVEQD